MVRIFIFVVTFMLFLSGCAAMLPKNLYVQKGDADPSVEGLVVFKMHGNGTGGLISYKPNHAMQLFILQNESPQYTFTTVSIDEYQVVKLPAGEWYLGAAVANDILLAYGGSEIEYDATRALPFKPFRIEAGETIYLGNIELDGVRYEQRITGLSENISYELTDRFDEAKQAVTEEMEQRFPQFPEARKRLIEKI